MQSLSPWIYLAALGLLVNLSTGCAPNEKEKEEIKASMLREIGVPEEPPKINADPLPPPPEVVSDPPDQGWLPESMLPYEHWEIQYMGNKPVGYLHRKIEPSTSQGPDTLRLSAESHTWLRGREQETQQKVSLLAYEKLNGELLNVEGTVTVGSNTRRFEGVVRDGNLKLSTNLLGRKTTLNFPWTPSDRGPFAIEQSLMRSPMKEGEQRTIKYFDPVNAIPIESQLVAYDYFETPTFNGQKETLLEIQVTSTSGDRVATSQIWVDRKGREHKSYRPALDQRSFRCDMESALVVANQSDLQDLPRRPIKVTGLPIESFDTGRKRFRVESIDPEYALVLPSSTHQVVNSIKPRQIDVTVYPASSLTQAIEGLQPEPSPPAEAVAASVLIDAKHPQIALLAQRLLEAEQLTSTDPIERRAYAFRKGIAERLKTIDFDGEVSRASATLAAGEADCFDHAALLTAICRSDGIPARVAIGLKYQRPRLPSMTLHAWTEFHDGSHWIPIDSSILDPMTSADRIKWFDSLWDTINPYREILNLAKHMSNLEVSVMRTTP